MLLVRANSFIQETMVCCNTLREHYNHERQIGDYCMAAMNTTRV